MTTYKQSILYLAQKLVIDCMLMIILIGFFTAIKHILEYLSTSIEVTDKGVILKRGMVGSTITEIPFTKINSLTVKKGLLGSMLGYGDVFIMAGNDVSGIPFKGIENPDQLKQIINSKQ